MSIRHFSTLRSVSKTLFDILTAVDDVLLHFREPGYTTRRCASQVRAYSQHKLGRPEFMCFRTLLYAVFHSIGIGFEGSKLKIVDQKASDGRVSQSAFQLLRWL